MVAGYFAFAALFFSRTLVDPGGRMVGGGSDAGQLLWNLAWVDHVAGHPQWPFHTDAQFASYGGLNLGGNASITFLGLVALPVTRLAGPVVAYNVISALSLPLAATTMFVLLRRWARVPGAGLGGFVFGFSPFVVAHALGQLNQSVVVLWPLIALAALPPRRGGSRSMWRGVALGLLVAAQLHTGSEQLVSAVIVGAAVLAVWWCLHRPLGVRAWVRTNQRYLAVAGGVAVVVCLPLLVEQALGANSLRGEVYQPAGVEVTDPLGLVVPIDSNAFTPAQGVFRPVEQRAITLPDMTYAVPFSGSRYEWTAYIGLPLLVLVALRAVRWRSLATVEQAALVLMGVATVASLGPALHWAGANTGVALPWAVVVPLPVVGSIVASRLMLFTYLGLAVVVACLFRRDGAQADIRLRALGAVGVAFLLPWPLFPSRLPEGRHPIPEIAAVPRCGGDGAVVLVEPASADIEGLVLQARSGFPFRLSRGSGYLPIPTEDLGFVLDGPFADPSRPLSTDERAAAVDQLDARGVTCVLARTSSAAGGGAAAMRELGAGDGVVLGEYTAWPRPDAGWVRAGG